MKQNIKITEDCEIMVVMTEKELSKKYTYMMTLGSTITCIGLGFLLFCLGEGTIKIILPFLGFMMWIVAMVNR